MKRRERNFILAVITVSPMLLALAGCASPTPSFYTLGSASEPESHQGVALYSVAIGPVTVPSMVDRPQIVLNTGPNRVSIAEESRWAEPLKESIPRAMADYLSRELPEAYVSAYPSMPISDPDYRVLIDVQRFDSLQGEAATIDILWVVNAGKDGTQTTGRSYRREPANGGDYAALVAAHQRALDAVSRDIAAVIKEKRTPPR